MKNMSYSLSERNTAIEYFQNLFENSLSGFIDDAMSVARLQIVIDIVKFDNWLREKHGDYEEQGKSMSDIIFEHYGDEAAALIDELL